jgi:hypothetical protein
MQKVHIFKSILSLTSVVGWMGAGGGVPHVLNLFFDTRMFEGFFPEGPRRRSRQWSDFFAAVAKIELTN